LQEAEEMAHLFVAPLLVSFGLGAGVVAVAKPAVSMVGRAARPMAKSVIVGGLVVGRSVQRAASEAGATLGDLVDEAREAIAADEAPVVMTSRAPFEPVDDSKTAAFE
jgi:hypothetical protein